MSRSFAVTEPHPTVPKTGGYVFTGGRGGAGNYRRYNVSELTAGPDASGPASRASLSRGLKRVVPAGRGGAGNYFTPTVDEEPIFQFDEELKRREAQAPVYHIGRGGAANFIDESKPSKTVRSASTHSAASQNSEASNHSVRNAFTKLTRKLSKE